MNAQLHFLIILLIFITILQTDCQETTDKPKGKPFQKFLEGLGITPKQPRKTSANKVSLVYKKEDLTTNKLVNAVGSTPYIKDGKSKSKNKLFRAVGITPYIKEDDINVLLNLAVYEADAMKVAAYKKLIKLFSVEGQNPSTKSRLIVAIIRAATELVKYYGATSNIAAQTRIVAAGQKYSKKCFELLKEEKNLCYIVTIQFFTAYMLSRRINIHRVGRKYIADLMTEANTVLPKDKALAFMQTQISCEIKLIVQNKTEYRKAINSIFIGNIEKEKNFDCVRELSEFKEDMSIIGSNIGEYYYLLGRAEAKNGDNLGAIESLKTARRLDVVVDTKRRSINKAVQQLIEKLYNKVM